VLVCWEVRNLTCGRHVVKTNTPACCADQAKLNGQLGNVKYESSHVIEREGDNRRSFHDLPPGQGQIHSHPALGPEV
jgi:hypothetical protein